ncbi:FecCD family ABC transporter permease [Desulfohalovibrio reitneri]|uniref:FecCD family ABC transporter permease n=1 Tax=Desulfohalovibrio reitneri TaxID=1307759 RepID=UPI0004A6D350|nr:iron ABC transporter permease [Desulfohalovibrio reitneri]
MHFHDGAVPEEYLRYTGRKKLLLALGVTLSACMLVAAVSVGSAGLPVHEAVASLLGMGDDKRIDLIVWSIRLPQALTAITAGAGLAVAGAVMQSILRNPLGSPFTLGISQAAAFGAAFSVMVLGSGIMTSTNAGAVTIANPYLTTATAFCFCLLAACVIIAVSRVRGASPETMVLCGVALGSLFTAGTMFLQYFADDVQLAAMVFWTFGDVARASWRELAFIAMVVVLSSIYFLFQSWNLNAIDAGDETAKGLGVRVERLRLVGMLVASLLTAVVVSFLGIIGFVGLVTPHMVRRLIGGDHRYLLPATIVLGALLLLAADTAARLLLAPHILPVSVLTAFLGAPVFLLLILRRRS